MAYMTQTNGPDVIGPCCLPTHLLAPIGDAYEAVANGTAPHDYPTIDWRGLRWHVTDTDVDPNGMGWDEFAFTHEAACSECDTPACRQCGVVGHSTDGDGDTWPCPDAA